MNQLEDDGERMVELGHPAVGPIQVRGTEAARGLRAARSLNPGAPQGGWGEGDTAQGGAGRAGSGWVHRAGRAPSEGWVLLSPDPPGGPEDGVAELSEPVHLPGEPAAACGDVSPGEPVRGAG